MNEAETQDALDLAWGFEDEPSAFASVLEVIPMRAGALQVWGSTTIVTSDLLGPNDAVRSDQLVYVGPRVMRAFEWQLTERLKWEGRDRRRIKRERRRFVKGSR